MFLINTNILVVINTNILDGLVNLQKSAASHTKKAKITGRYDQGVKYLGSVTFMRSDDYSLMRGIVRGHK